MMTDLPRAVTTAVMELAAEQEYYFTYSLLSYALSNEKIEVMQWLRSTGYQWQPRDFEDAVKSGSLACVIYLHQDGCPSEDEESRMMTTAASRGHLEIMKWLREKEFTWSALTMREAIRGGHFDVVKWLVSHACPWGRNEVRIAEFLNFDHMAEWMQQHSPLLFPHVESEDE